MSTGSDIGIESRYTKGGMGGGGVMLGTGTTGAGGGG